MTYNLHYDYINRFNHWMLLEHGPVIQDKLDGLVRGYLQSLPKFTSDKLYFGCGHDSVVAKYRDWDLCDLRDVRGVIKWDVLLGLPYCDGALSTVKTKLSLGMFTYQQVQFVLYEAARTLRLGGVLEVTFRDFDKLLARRDELDNSLFIRYIHGSGQYYGSRRRSCWTPGDLILLADRYAFEPIGNTWRGMNATVEFERVDRKLRSFPEPKVVYDPSGVMINDGGDFHSERR